MMHSLLLAGGWHEMQSRIRSTEQRRTVSVLIAQFHERLSAFPCDTSYVCVEVDGASHSFGRRPEKDTRRDAWLADRGIRTLRISASLVLDEVDGAVRMIVDAARGGGGVF